MDHGIGVGAPLPKLLTELTVWPASPLPALRSPLPHERWLAGGVALEEIAYGWRTLTSLLEEVHVPARRVAAP